MRWRLALGLLAVAALALAEAATGPTKLDPEFEKVTCGSAIKLTHVVSGYKLHSHEIPYGTGSGQQSVTGFPENNDPNSYFIVEGAHGGVPCQRGEAVRCGTEVRLRHASTQRRLHSHLHTSPLSGNQEVSCFGDHFSSDTGDNWVLQCVGREQYWTRELPVRLLHKDTNRFLASSQRFKYQHPIPGQQEVYATSNSDREVSWTAQEGVYVADRSYKL